MSPELFISAPSSHLLLWLILFAGLLSPHSPLALHFTQPGKFNVAILHSIQTQSRTDNCHGPISPAQFSLTEVVRRTIQRINRDSHLLPNVPLGFIFIDACHSPRRSLHEAVRLLTPTWAVEGQANWTVTSEDKLPVIGVVGGENSEAAALLSTYLQLYKLPLVTIASMPNELSDSRHHPYLFRLAPSARKLGYVVANILRHFQWTYVTIIHDTSAVNRDTVQSLQRSMRKLHLCYALREIVPLDAGSQEFTPIFYRILEYFKNGRVIVLLLNPYNARAFLKTLKSLGLANRFVLVWTDSLHAYSKQMSRGSNGSLWVTAYSEKSDIPRTLQNLTYFHLNGNPWASEYWKQIYRCKWDYRSTRSCLKYAGEVIGVAKSLGGIAAQFDERAFMIEVAVETFAKALHNAITIYCPQYFSAKHKKTNPDTCITGNSMMAALRSLNLYVNNAERKSIHFRFDTFGDLATSELQVNQAINISNTTLFRTVGYYLTETDSLELWDNHTFWRRSDRVPASVCSVRCGPSEAVIWRSSCCWNCLRCPVGEILAANKTRCHPCPLYTWPNQTDPRFCSPLDLLDFSSFQLISSINGFLGVCGLTVSFCVGICLVKWRREKLFRATGFFYHLFLLLCVSLLFAHTLSYARPPRGVQCVVRQAAPALLFTVIYGSILASSIRVYLILQASTRLHSRQGTMSRAVLTAIILFVVLLQALLVSTIYSLHGMPQTRTSILHSAPRPFLEIHCSHSNISTHLPTSYHTVVLSLAFILAFRARRHAANSREGLALTFTTFLSLLAWIVYFILRECLVVHPWQSTLIHLLLVHLTAFIVLTGIFLTKLFTLACAVRSPQHPGLNGHFRRSCSAQGSFHDDRQLHNQAALSGLIVQRWYKGRLSSGRYVSEERLSIRDRPRELHESSI